MILALLPLAFAVPAQDTGSGEDVDMCTPAHPTLLLPLDGSNNVSPDVLPAVLVDAECGAGDIQLLLTAADGVAVAFTLHAEVSGLQWVPELPLAADTHYTFSAATPDWGEVHSLFSTGNEGLPPLSGSPSLTIAGSELLGGHATVSLQIEPVVDPSGAAYRVDRGSVLIGWGVDPRTMVDAFEGVAGDEICYTLTQFRGDGSEWATSDPACVTLEAEEEETESKSGCSTVGAAGLGEALAILALGMSARRWRRA